VEVVVGLVALLALKGYPHGKKLGHGKVIASVEQVEIP
jgi:hypothetical protein